MKDIENISKRVLAYLQSIPETRDNDSMLIGYIHWGDLKKLYGNPNNCPIKDYFKLLKDGNLSPVDSITRARRKWQEKTPSLQGTRWVERHTKKTDEAKQQIKDKTIWGAKDELPF